LAEGAAHGAKVLLVTHGDARREALPSPVTDQYSIRLIGDVEYLEEAIDSFQPGVIVIETDLPDQDGFTAMKQVRVYSPTIGVLALTPEPPAHAQVALATRAGADGFIGSDAGAETFIAAVDALLEGGTWFPPEATRRVISASADDLDTTASERRSRLSGVVFALIPLTGLIASVQVGLWRSYMGQIGVRPTDLGVDPTSRVIDVIVAMLLVLGIFGPLLFVGSWVDMLRESKLNRGLIGGFLRHTKLSYVTVSVLWLMLAAAIDVGTDLVLVVIVGPIVTISIIAQAVGASDELPRIARIDGIALSGAIVGASLMTFIFIGVLAYEVQMVGPDLRFDGEHGFLAPRVLGVNAIPVEANNINTGEVSEVLYLGGNADLYILVDVCDNDRVDYVSVSTQRLVVIDEITCLDTDVGS
jgi:DNA-binding NarL/FixJ family response regulator